MQSRVFEMQSTVHFVEKGDAKKFADNRCVADSIRAVHRVQLNVWWWPDILKSTTTIWYAPTPIIGHVIVDRIRRTETRHLGVRCVRSFVRPETPSTWSNYVCKRSSIVGEKNRTFAMFVRMKIKESLACVRLSCLLRLPWLMCAQSRARARHEIVFPSPLDASTSHTHTHTIHAVTPAPASNTQWFHTSPSLCKYLIRLQCAGRSFEIGTRRLSCLVHMPFAYYFRFFFFSVFVSCNFANCEQFSCTAFIRWIGCFGGCFVELAFFVVFHFYFENSSWLTAQECESTVPTVDFNVRKRPWKFIVCAPNDISTTLCHPFLCFILFFFFFFFFFVLTIGQHT